MDIFNIIQTWTAGQIALTVIDITIVAFVAYKLLVLIKGTRAIQLLKGLALLAIVSLVAGRIGLATVDWILNNAALLLLVAIPIVFQPELRRALEHLGRGHFSGMPFLVQDEEITEFIGTLTDSLETLAERRIGALIVIERETGLKEYIEEGNKVDALITPDLLINIFFPNSPLHDGAVIISGNRIAAAGCFLPLTESPFLSKELGTRHRAAIGITEESDAVSLVVSEETGIIALAYDGKITRYLDVKQVEEILKELLCPEGAYKRTWHHPFWIRR